MRFYSLEFLKIVEFLIKLVQAEMNFKDMGITASLESLYGLLSIT